MINVSEICSPSELWVSQHGGDTSEQAQLRACLVSALEGLDLVDQIRVGADLVNLMRNELMAAASNVRKHAAVAARRDGMRPADIAAAAKQSPQTISRLLVRGSQAS